MKLKPAILSVLARDDLKHIVYDLEIDGVDRRSVDGMRAALGRARRVKPEDLLWYMQKGQIQEICEVVGVSPKGKRDDLVGRLLNGPEAKPQRKRRSSMNQDVQQELAFNGAPEPVSKKPEKLTLARLESLLFKACDILRGNMDASEYKEYIFGMLFLKRTSDQFDGDQAVLRAEYGKKGMKPALIDKQLANPDKYDFFVPTKAHWSKIRHLKESVGSGLNKALAAIEDANPDILQDVLKTINFNRKVGQRTMDDSTLVEFIQHFDEIPLSNDDFEFPDLLGAAYEYLIKYFADSAGKKGGEFYTPSEVVRMMVRLIEPQVAASGWGPELIPEEDILQSQFPEVLDQIEKDQARIAELEGLFAAADAADEEEEGEESDNGVLPKSKVKALKAEKKALNGEIRQIKKQVKEMRKDAERMEGIGGSRKEINMLRTDASDIEGEGLEKYERVEQIDAELARHVKLETELKTLKANIRASEKKKDDLVAAARAKISEGEAKQLILERFQRLLTDEFDGYLRQYQRTFIASVENLWDKYAVTTKQILAERDQEADQLNSFLKELGYE